MVEENLGLSIDALYQRMVQQAPLTHSYWAKGKGEPLAAWQQRLRSKLLELLAIDGKPRQPPRVRFLESQRCDGYVRHRGYMIAADELAVPVYVLEPANVQGKMGVCIAAHGHGPGKILPVGISSTEAERALIVEGERDYAVQAAQRGYLTIAPDFRGMGELVLAQDVNENRRSCLQLFCRSVQLGRPLLGQRVSDVMQLLDWALARQDVDRGRVVITGNSGGGTMTLFSAAVDGRFTAAAPSCYFSTFAGSTMAMHHCPCNFLPGLGQVAEMSDLAGLFAPRPMLIIAGTKDTIFPIDAVRKGFADLQGIYRDAAAADRVELYEGDGGHRYYKARVWDFFTEKLGG